MQLKQKKTRTAINPDILVIADCINGATKASWFVTRNLHFHNSVIMLLQTYQKYSLGQSMVRNIVPLLENTARRELTELKNQIVSNTGINPKSISKSVIEGDLTSVLRQRFRNKAGTVVVLGIEHDSSNLCISCKKQIVSVLKSGIRPIYLVGKGITLISNERATFFSVEENMQDGDYYAFLKKNFNKLGIQHSIMSSSTDSLLKRVIPDSDPDSNSWTYKDEYPLAEKLFRSLNESGTHLGSHTNKHS